MPSARTVLGRNGISTILGPQQAATAAVEAIGDDEMMAPHGIAMTLAFIECVPRSAVAAATEKAAA